MTQSSSLMLVLLLGLTPFVSLGGADHSETAAPNRCGSPSISAAADALAAKFEDHQFLFVGSTHGDAKIEEFLACLVTRPAFQRRATDIVTEWASSGQQQLLDRYVLKLEPAPAGKLDTIFLDNDSPSLWISLPPIRQTIETLREVNRTLPPQKRIRLVGGNEGIDWAKITTPEDFAPYPYKTNLMPHLILEQLAKTPGNRTLVVYGEAHIRYQARNFMGELEAALGRSKLFVVGAVRELKEEERRYLAAMGDPAKSFFADAAQFPAGQPWPSSMRTSFEEQPAQPLADYIDGLLYLGPDRDRDLTGSIPLSEAQKRELDRRNSFRSDPQRVMRARYQGREQWFRAHPNDLAPRPQ
jgi:hypothetical protein